MSKYAMTIPDLTVVICCYNSEDVIYDTLMALCSQDTSFPWSLLIVNNNSNDNTVSIVKQFKKADVPWANLEIIDEGKPGVAYARRRGIDYAKSDFVIFCDDDTRFESTYIQTAWEILTNNNGVDAVGGWCTVEYQKEPEEWLRQIPNAFASRSEPIAFKRCTHLLTGGLAFRRKAFVDLYNRGYVPVLSGRKGDSYGGGEDLEMTGMLTLLGYNLYLSPDMKFVHYISSDRMTWKHLKQTALQEGRTAIYLLPGVWRIENSRWYKRTGPYVFSVALFFYLRHVFRRGPYNALQAYRYLGRIIEIVKFYRALKEIDQQIDAIITKSEKHESSLV